MRSASTPSPQFALPTLEARPQFRELAAERLPTNTTTNQHAVHRWFNFIAGFAPEFVAQQCRTISDGVLLDPFAGCGTSLVVAQSLGLRAVGFEPHPFFVRIARAKTDVNPTKARLAAIEVALIEGIHNAERASPLTDSASTFLGKLFEDHTLRALLGARATLASAGFGEDDLAFLMLSRVVEMCSKAQTDGIYKAPTTRKTPAAPLAAIRSVVNDVRCDAGLTERATTLPQVFLYAQSSEDMSVVGAKSVDIVVTSPPYLNNFDFAEMTRMHLYFWGTCGSWRDITDTVRSRLVVNTTTALTGHRDIQSEHRQAIPGRLLPDLDRIVLTLRQERRVRAGTKEYDLLVYPYFAQMTRVLREALRCLDDGGAMHLVVADAAFYGTHVSTPQFLASSMAELGFQSIHCIKLRDRGHRWILDKRDGSPTGLGEYHIVAKRRCNS